MKKLVLITVLLMFFSNLSVCFGESLSNQQKTGLNQIAMMYYQNKSQSEIKSSWENFIKANPKISVDDSLSYLKQEVKRIGEDRLQKAKQTNPKPTPQKLQQISQGNQSAANMVSDMQKDMHDTAKRIIDNMKA